MSPSTGVSSQVSDSSWTIDRVAILQVSFETGGLPAARAAFPDRTDASIKGCLHYHGIKSSNFREQIVWTIDRVAKLREAFEGGGLRAARSVFPDRTDNALRNAVKRFNIKYTQYKNNATTNAAYAPPAPVSRHTSRKAHAPHKCADCGAPDFTLPFAGTKIRKCRDPRVCARRMDGKPGAAMSRRLRGAMRKTRT